MSEARKAVEQMSEARKAVEQLRREASVPRTPVSQAAADLVKYTQERQSDDVLVKGFGNQRENPFKEKSACVII